MDDPKMNVGFADPNSVIDQKHNARDLVHLNNQGSHFRKFFKKLYRPSEVSKRESRFSLANFNAQGLKVKWEGK